MADYAITGKKGTGKSKAAVFLMRKYLAEKRAQLLPVATRA